MAGGNAGLFGGIGPVAAVNQAYAPQQQYLQQQQASRNAALQAIFQAILGALPSQQSVDAPYMAASADTNNLARASAAGLQAANPDAQTQAGLRAIGAPASQQQQVGNIDNTSFNGNAALLQYAGGVIPSGVFNQDMQARNTYLASLPAILAGYAKQGVGQLAGIADKENMGLASDRANALMQARTNLANFVQKNQAAKANAAYKNAELGLKSQNQAFTQKFKTAQLNDQNFWKGQSLNLQAKKFAQQTISQDRNYQLALKRVGISERGLQLRIAQSAYTQAHGGYSAAKIAGFNTKMDALLASGGAPTRPGVGPTVKDKLGNTLTGGSAMPTKTYFDKNGKPIKLAPDGSVPPGVKVSSVKNANTYGSFIAAALKKGVPIQLAIQRANTIWPETQREDLGSLASLPAIAQQSAQQARDYQKMTGQILGTSPSGVDIRYALPPNLSTTGKHVVRGVLQLASEYLGTPYAWGGGGPNGPSRGTAQGANTVGFDCSSFAEFLYAKEGITIPRTTYEQFKTGLDVPRNRLQAGDLVFFKGTDSRGGLPGHVGIYIGNNNFVEAPHTGDVVKVSHLSGYPGYMGARRYVK